MSISLTSALTIPKVSQDYASNVASSRFQDPSQSIYPAYMGQDNMGRQAHPDTYVTLTAGASNPLARIVVENSHRASYHQFLNADGIEGDFQNSVPSFGRYDTMVGKNPGRDMQNNLNGQYVVPSVSRSAGQAYQEAGWVDINRRAMQGKYQAQKFSRA
jgi:hypothetical protein